MSLLAYRRSTALAAALFLIGGAGVAAAQDAQPQPEEAPTTAAPNADKAEFGVDVRVRYINTPTWLLNLFLDHSTPMSSVSYGADFVRRKGKFDINFGVEYANISPQNGLYLSKGDDPSMVGQFPDFVEFKSLALVTLDASFIWHVPMGDRVAFRYGAGIGIGFVLGDIKQTKTTCPSTTTASDLDDPQHCTPDPTMTKLADKPPVVPIPSLLVGLRIKIIDQLSLNLEAGFKLPSFFAGGSIGYFF